MSSKGLQNLQQYSWPGNVRELQNLIEREIILSTHGQLSFHTLPATVTSPQATGALTMAQAEAAHIVSVLNMTHWRISGPQGAAAMLDMPASTLRSRMKKLAITR